MLKEFRFIKFTATKINKEFTFGLLFLQPHKSEMFEIGGEKT